jgi:ABC-type nitrate/sulfonate/bicarbonate transport system ATPase subunit
MALLELKNVGKGYGAGAARREVLSGVNLSIEDGEFVAIVGFSGSGKTTLVSRATSRSPWMRYFRNGARRDAPSRSTST